MARKRKVDKTFSEPQNNKAAKYGIEETFNNSEDEFYAGRDKILLDESADSKRRRRLIEQEKDLQPSDEEILGYQDTDEEDDVSEEDGEDDEDNYQDLNVRSKTGRKARDEDVDEEEEPADENWGTNRADYYNADVIETEADALLEENEAKRLFQKQLKNMTEADFGFDEDAWTEQKEESKGRSTTEKLPDAQIPEGATEQQKLDILRSRYPELQPLAEEFERLQKVKEGLDVEAAAAGKSVKTGAAFTNGLPVAVKRNALAAYLATISMYFAILSSTTTKEPKKRTITAISPIELHEHAIIQSLTRARQLWDRVEHADIAEPLPSNPLPVKSSQINRAPEHEEPEDSMEMDAAPSVKPLQRKKSTKGPLQDIRDEKLNTPRDDPSVTTNKKKKSKSEPKRKFNDAELQALISITNRTAGAASEESDIGEEQPLTATEAAEKQRKRKSLRFYTSQIASKASKRGHASREAGGDDDLPYKERARDRIERLNREAVARGHAQGDADLDGEPATPRGPTGRRMMPDGTEWRSKPSVESHAPLSASRTSEEARYDINDRYYDSLLDAQAQKKTDKRARAEAHAEAAKQGAEVYEEETVGPDGKRAITYAIAKNKGLAPKRKKEVRNPRVKKRKKYDEKMKKLGSVRQVYKGGEGRGGYRGELTGIKTNVVKSIKL